VTTIACAVAHAPWLSDRVAMMAELRPQLQAGADFYFEATEKCHWTKWSRQQWDFGLSTGADWLFVTQDDAEVAPQLWPTLRAIVEAWPEEPFISLAAVHSQAREVARQGRRSYRSDRVIGWGYMISRATLQKLVWWCDTGGLDDYRAKFPGDGEDSMLAVFLALHGIRPRTPVPTVVDHRFCKSTNEGFDDHTHRRSVVTWRDYSPADIATPSWWQSTCSDLGPDAWRACGWCGTGEAAAKSDVTGMMVCGPCGHLIARQLGLEDPNANRMCPVTLADGRKAVVQGGKIRVVVPRQEGTLTLPDGTSLSKEALAAMGYGVEK